MTVQELRRGVDPACVHCLAFSRGDRPDWLALSSDKVESCPILGISSCGVSVKHSKAKSQPGGAEPQCMGFRLQGPISRDSGPVRGSKTGWGFDPTYPRVWTCSCVMEEASCAAMGSSASLSIPGCAASAL